MYMRIIKMDQNMKVRKKMDRDMDLENIIIKIMGIMRVNGKIIK